MLAVLLVFTFTTLLALALVLLVIILVVVTTLVSIFLLTIMMAFIVTAILACTPSIALIYGCHFVDMRFSNISIVVAGRHIDIYFLCIADCFIGYGYYVDICSCYYVDICSSDIIGHFIDICSCYLISNYCYFGICSFLINLLAVTTMLASALLLPVTMAFAIIAILIYAFLILLLFTIMS